MRKRMLKKSEVLREGYMKGLRKALKIINEMINKNEDLNRELWMASRLGHQSRILSSLKNGADVNCHIGQQQETPLHAALLIEPNVNVLLMLIDNDADINAKDRSGNTPLHTAASCGMAMGFSNLKEINIYITACEFLIKSGANVNAKSKYGYTPLHIAAINGYPDICKTLIDNGADVNVKDMDGYTPIDVAKPKSYSFLKQYEN